MSLLFLGKLLEDFVDWAKKLEDCRAIILFGSTARGQGDEYLDHDIQVIVTNRDNEEYINWIRDYAPIWTLNREGNVSKPLWAVMYRGGHKVHLSVISVDDLQTVIDSGELTMDYQRGYKSLVDKDDLIRKLAPPQLPIYTPPSQTEFAECVLNFVYGTTLVGAHLKRGSLWTVQWGNCIERRFLLQMIEWHTHALNPDKDAWDRGRNMQDWVEDETWQALHGIAGRFDSEDSWRALFAMNDIFQKLAQETAMQLGYSYPNTVVSEVIAYLEGLYTL